MSQGELSGEQQRVRCVEPFKEMKRLKVGRVAFIIVMKILCLWPQLYNIKMW